MIESEEYAEILQEAKRHKAKTATALLRQQRGPLRWFLSLSHRLFRWVERESRAALRDDF